MLRAISWSVVGLVAGLGIVAQASSNDPRDKGPNTIDVSKYPKEMQESYALFAAKCSKCHSLARPINARVEQAEWWKDYVRKMMRKPGSGINQEAGKTIYQFLVFYHEQKKAAEAK
jgi:hypothetical protein